MDRCGLIGPVMLQVLIYNLELQQSTLLQTARLNLR